VSFGALPSEDMPRPPASDVEWKVRMPSLNLAEFVEDRAVATGASFLSRRVRRTVLVSARTWFEARAEAALYWARKGVHFSPSSIREGEILT
jgi:hypothetical protein